MESFREPDWSAPLDLETRLAMVPADAVVKGVFFRSALRQAQARGGPLPGRKEYSAMSSYPVRELIEVLAACAKLVHPNVPPREGLRRLGQNVFPAMKDVPAGTFLFSIAGNEVVAAFKLVGRAYSLFSQGRATAAKLSEGNARVELRNAWTFPTAYHVGVFEGSVRAFGKTPRVLCRELSLCDVDLDVAWQ